MTVREENDKIFKLKPGDFEALAIEIFRKQYLDNPIYNKYVETIGCDHIRVNELSKIPFLPIRFFKSHSIKTGDFHPELLFESSGTTGMINSKHEVKDAQVYLESFLTTFESFYGSTNDLTIIGLLPSYLQRKGSSLVYMVNELIQRSGQPESGFYLNEFEKLAHVLTDLEKRGRKTLLIGVTFALLDFAEAHPIQLEHTIVMETGGMKGRRQELIRAEVHDILKHSFGLQQIHSEYGMTELLSQAYSSSNGIFHCPEWMRVFTRDEEDPFEVFTDLKSPRSGAINIIDLANKYSCSFIATDDAGKVYPDGSFEILGRLDNSDIRGCSLLSLEA